MLSQAVLRATIAPLFVPATMPKSLDAALTAWIQAYISYAQSALAGGTVPSALVPTPIPDPMFFSALDSSLRAMWMVTPWVGPGLVGTTAIIPPLAPLLAANASVLISSRDPNLALSLITESLHNYTLAITVSVVPPSGTPVISPLT